MHYKSFKVLDSEVNAAGDEGVVEAIVSVFGVVDSMNEVVVPGAFAESLARRTPKVVWMHDAREPIGKTVEARELLPGDALLPDDIRPFGGLYVRGVLNLETQRGKEAFSDIKFGVLDEFSIGYDPVEVNSRKDGVLELRKIELYEWSPVLFGANPATELVSVKSSEGEQVGSRAQLEAEKDLIARALAAETEEEMMDVWNAAVKEMRRLQAVRSLIAMRLGIRCDTLGEV